MATLMNPFDLLGSEGVEDPMLLIQSLPLKLSADSASKKPGQSAAAKLPSKPLPPSQAVREAKNEGNRGGSRGGYSGSRGGYGGARGGSRGYGRDAGNEVNSFNSTITPSSQAGPDGGDAFKPAERRSYNGPRGGYRGGYRNEEGGDGERQRRPYERRSGSGRGNEFKREGSGRGNWGTQEDEITPVPEAVGETEKIVSDEKPAENEDVVTESIKEAPPAEAEEKEPEDKSMTLEEYEKVLEEKRKALQTLKSEERKVDVKEFESMQQLSNKKDNNDIFVKLGSEKDKKKEAYEKEEKAKKSVSINEFLKPAEGERYFSPGGRGRGRGRGGRGSYGGGDHRGMGNNAPSPDSPSIADPKQFPTLGGK